MLTFEEFSAKKKIDLTQFQQAEPALYSEFKREYGQMGEKSFDHSKKFLFNKLRRAYHLKEEQKPAKTVVELTEIASQAETLSSPTNEQKPAYTPKFKPRITAQPITPAASDQALNPENEEIEKPADIKEQTEQKSEAKPAFKPRFNMKNIKPASEE